MAPAAALDAPASERWVPLALSVAVHVVLIALFGWSWWHFRRPLPAPRQLAIEATVVLEQSTAAQPAPASTAPSPVPPDAAAVRAAEQAREEQAREEQAREEQAREASKRQAAEAEAQRQAEVRRAADAKRAADQQQAAEQRRVAERRKAAEQKRLADEAARHEKERQAAEQAARERARMENDLRAQMANEERINAARGSADAAAYRSMIQARIQRAWIRPAGAQKGVNCEVRVTQVPGGEVTGVQIARCNGDAALRESIEAAVYRASPLPVPTNPDLFDRNLTLNFHPDD